MTNISVFLCPACGGTDIEANFQLAWCYDCDWEASAGTRVYDDARAACLAHRENVADRLDGMRENVARAMYDELMAKARTESVHVQDWEDVSAYHREQLLRQADAAISVMLETFYGGEQA